MVTDVMVHWADVEDFSGLQASLLGELTRSERTRADRFRKGEDVLRYLVGRRLLGHVLDRGPRRVDGTVLTESGPYGKPRSPGGPSFNLSASGRLVLCAIVPDGEVGVDVEAIQHHGDLEDVAARHFSASEYRVLSRCSGADWLSTFFRVWTVKEAVLKAHGIGLGHPLEDVEIDPEATEGLCILRTAGASTRSFAWRCLAAPIAGYALAVALEGTLAGVSIQRYRP
jgi:4'-phosphopantetheinyl transferase